MSRGLKDLHAVAGGIGTPGGETVARRLPAGTRWNPWTPTGTRTSNAEWRKPRAWDKAHVAAMRARLRPLSQRPVVRLTVNWMDERIPTSLLASFLTLIAETIHVRWVLRPARAELLDTRLRAVELLGTLFADSGTRLAREWRRGWIPENVTLRRTRA